VELDLYFERFLNPARSSPPDIDTDFCSRRRDDVIRYLFNSYGKERVAMVGTINTFRPRSALGKSLKRMNRTTGYPRPYQQAFPPRLPPQLRTPMEEGKAEHLTPSL
jgi:DNA polymerase III alpha subunit